MNISEKVDLRRIVAYVSLLTVAMLLFKTIYNVVFLIDDDTMHYLYAQSGTLQSAAISGAYGQGRIQNFPLTYLSGIPFLANSMLVYKIISYGGITFAVCAMGYLLKRHVDENFALISMVAFFGLAQVDAQHNLFICYILTHQLTLGFIMLSIERQITYYKSHKKKDMVISAAWLTLSVMCYEAFFLFCFVSFFISMYAILSEKQKNVIKAFLLSMKDLVFHIVFVGVYLGIYEAWRIANPSVYEGNQLGVASIGRLFRTTLTYALGMFPGQNFYFDVRNFGISQVMGYMSVLYLIGAAIAALAVVVLVRKIHQLNKTQYIALFSLSIISVFIPCILVGMTGKYQEWVYIHGSRAYVPSYYSYFAIIILLITVMVFIYQKVKANVIKNILIGIYAVVAFAGVLTTCVGNNKFAKEVAAPNLALQSNFDAIVSSDYFNDMVEDGAVLYIPDGMSLNGQMSNLYLVTDMYTDKSFTFVNTLDGVDFTTPVYEIQYDKKSQTGIFGKLNEDKTYANSKVFGTCGNGKINHFSRNVAATE